MEYPSTMATPILLCLNETKKMASIKIINAINYSNHIDSMDRVY